MSFASFHEYLSIFGGPNLVAGTPVAEASQTDYEAGVVRLGAELWRIRTARLTPKKVGAFVAVWQRDTAGNTSPISVADDATGLLVFVREGDQFGVFRFTAADLERLLITQSDTQPGKRGFRVYPSWCTGLNAQAHRTQRDQAPCFTVLRS